MYDEIKNYIEYIETNLFESISIDSLSETFNYSVAHLHRLFKGFTGLTIKQYIINRRLSEAALMIRNSDKSILDIALECGFDNDMHFAKMFKRKFDVTPSSLRRSNQYIVLTKEIKLDSGESVMKIKNLETFRDQILAKKDTAEIKQFIASVEGCVFSHLTGSDLEVVLVLYDDLNRGKKLMQYEINLLNGRENIKIIYDILSLESVEIKNLRVVNDKIIFHFYDAETKAVSDVELFSIPEKLVEFSAAWVVK